MSFSLRQSSVDRSGDRLANDRAPPVDSDQAPGWFQTAVVSDDSGARENG